MGATADRVVEVDRLRKSYGDHEVLRGISFHVRRGEVFGLLGPNGAGKTTALETLVGLRRPTSGTVEVLGLVPARDRRAFTERVSVQPQAAALFPTLTVFETLRLFASFYSGPRDPESVISEFGLEAARRTRVKHLSGGQQRRLLLGIASIGNPEILVLDEPSAGLDPASRRNLWDVIERQRELGATVILSTHQMDEATRLCDRLAILVAGRIEAEGSPEELIREHSRVSTVAFFLPERSSSGDAAAVAVAELERAGITGGITASPERDGLRIAVETEDPDGVLRRIAFTPGLHATGFRVIRSSLEDVFLEVSDGA